MVSGNADSPWHQATFLTCGTTVKTTEGKVARQVPVVETTDADGDSTWSALWRPAGRAGTLWFIQGTGK